MKIVNNYFLPVFILLCILSIHDAKSQKKAVIDSLLKLLKKDVEDSNKVKHLNTLSFALYRTVPDSTILLATQAVKLSQQIHFAYGESNGYGNIGTGYYVKGEYTTALDYYFKAFNADQALNNQKGMAKHLGNIGTVYSDQGNYPQALDYYLKALKLDEQTGNKKGMASRLGNIGNIYLGQLNYPKALDYYLKALKISEELGNKTSIANWLGGVGIVYSAQGDYPRSLDYYFKALKIAEEINDKRGMAIHNNNIGKTYQRQKDYPKAINYYLRSLKITEEIDDKNDAAINYGSIGSIYTTTGKYTDAYNYLSHAISISKSIGAKNNMRDDYENLSELYEKSTISLPDTTNGKLLNKEEMRLKALYYYKKFKAMRDTIFSEENKKEIVRKEMNFDFEKKEAATKAEQDKKDAITKEELKQKEQQRNYFIAGFVLVALLAAFILRGYREKQKANKIITEQKHLVDEKQKEILDSIHYAKRIQTALITSEKYIDRTLNRMKNEKTE